MIVNFKPTVEFWEQGPGLDGMLKHIERCGRISYKSEDKITDDSYKEFVERMIKLGHGAVLEHGTVYLQVEENDVNYNFYYSRYSGNKYSKCHYLMAFNGIRTGPIFITTNYRVLLQGDYETWDEAMKNGYKKNWLDDLKYIVEPNNNFEKRFTFHIITDRGVSAEGNRHRVNSIIERSTRYCDYSGGKFGGQVRVMVPPEFFGSDHAKTLEHLNEDPSASMDMLQSLCGIIASGAENDRMQELESWLFANLACEYSYHRLRKLGWTTQQARRVLPLDLETEMAYTVFKSDWMHFLGLRCDPHAHPDMQVVANQIKETLNFKLC